MSLTDPVVEPLRQRVAELETENTTLRREVGTLQRRLKRVVYLARTKGCAITRNEILAPEQRR